MHVPGKSDLFENNSFKDQGILGKLCVKFTSPETANYSHLFHYPSDSSLDEMVPKLPFIGSKVGSSGLPILCNVHPK